MAWMRRNPRWSIDDICAFMRRPFVLLDIGVVMRMSAPQRNVAARQHVRCCSTSGWRCRHPRFVGPHASGGDQVERLLRTEHAGWCCSGIRPAGPAYWPNCSPTRWRLVLQLASRRDPPRCRRGGWRHHRRRPPAAAERQTAAPPQAREEAAHRQARRSERSTLGSRRHRGWQPSTLRRDQRIGRVLGLCRTGEKSPPGLAARGL